MLYSAVPILGGVWIIWKPFKDEAEDLQKFTNLVAWIIVIMGTVILVALMTTMHFVAYSGGPSHPLLSRWIPEGLCGNALLEAWDEMIIIMIAILYSLAWSLLIFVSWWNALLAVPPLWYIAFIAESPREREDRLLLAWGK
jgi:hypothetical protein